MSRKRGGESRRKFLGSVGAAALVASAPLKGRGAQKTGELHPFGFVIHGGAGTIERSRMTPERERAYREKLTEALLAGYEVLKKGGGSLDAVVAAILLMEDSPLFNAGR
ncbi:MAG TPA: isoaspartyl peptidase/L-asparaginase, partial [Pyrinomonadaceae bacterium]